MRWRTPGIDVGKRVGVSGKIVELGKTGLDQADNHGDLLPGMVDPLFAKTEEGLEPESLPVLWQGF